MFINIDGLAEGQVIVLCLKIMGQHRNELVNQTYPYPNLPTKPIPL
jgi:hypothetical protein